MANERAGRQPNFVEQTVLVPRSLWERVEAMSASSAKEPSELVADALRLLISGSVPAAPASVGGTVRSLTEATPQSAPAHLGAESVQLMLTDVQGEELGSEKLMKRFREIMAAVEQKDAFITRHSESVAELAQQLVGNLGLEGNEALAIQTAALIHDIGKSRVPEAILSKKGKLTPDEWALVKRYPEFSAEIIAGLPGLEAVVPSVLYHQERWDGSGYPKGLREDDIPLGAQVVGICDVYDVLTSDRAYRPALPPDIARRTIEGGIGRLWNPKIAEILLQKVIPT